MLAVMSLYLILA